MSYQIREDSSLEAMIDYSDSVAAGLAADSEAEPLCKDWDVLSQKLGQALIARNEARQELLRASAKVRVCDVQWDAVLLGLSERAYLEAGKKSGSKPYSALFGRVTARRASHFGPGKAFFLGDELISMARALDHPFLREEVANLQTANDALKEAAEARQQAQRALRSHELVRSELHDELQTLVDRTEADILKLRPGQDELVRAILAPDRPKRALREPPADLEPDEPADEA
jgi:hypothetical protein